ncbi:MAG: hypothetical protein KBS59_06350, partial [Clostridiales bacterium]|nr:hypothetical protein [Clostridiales bacterium]
MKKILCFALVLLMCAALVSCGDDPSGTTEPTQPTTPTTASTLPSSSATDEPDIPVVIDIKNDPVKTDVGEYVTVMYNPAYANIETDVKKGVGSKENVTLTLTLNDGYVFDGWSVGNIMANGAKCVSTELTFTYEASESDTGARTMVYPNYSATLVYHANGGTSTTGELFTQTYPVTWYKCPSTLPEQGYFTREGYTLVEYNTKPDGTGYGVSLGSRMPLDDKPSVELYCIWAKQNDASDFDYVTNGGNIVIKGYKGTSETVVIPDTIDGKKVTTIHDLGEPETAVKTVILSKNV